MSQVRVRRRFADVAAFAIWVVYASIYALSFALGGAPSIAIAIRSALANAIPDGFLGLAVHQTSRRIDRDPAAAAHLVRRHVPWAVSLVALAVAGKILLKVGFFAKFWKLILLGGGALIAWLVKIFRKKKETEYVYEPASPASTQGDGASQS